MRTLRVAVLSAIAVCAAFGQKKEQFADMQRDIATIDGNVKDLQKTLPAALGELKGIIGQLSNSVDSSNTKMQAQLQAGLEQQQAAVKAPVANLNGRLDQIAQSFQELKETILDMNSRIGKMDAKLQDLQHQIQIGSNPPPAPGSSVVAPPGGSGGGMATGGPAPGACPSTLQADTTYSNARRDWVAANYDIAMQEFSDYARCFPSTQYAPNSQFYIGDIYYKKGDYDNSLKAFDTVVERFPENPKTGDAHYMKGLSLLKLNQRDAAAKEFRLVVSKYPNTDSAAQARLKLKELGLSAGPAPRRRK